MVQENERLIKNILTTRSPLNKNQIQSKWYSKIEGYRQMKKDRQFVIKIIPEKNSPEKNAYTTRRSPL